jgi:hypothetical protein
LPLVLGLSCFALLDELDLAPVFGVVFDDILETICE